MRAGGRESDLPAEQVDTEEEQEEKVSNSFSLGADEEPDSLTESPQKLPTHTQLVKDYVTPSMMNGESQNWDHVRHRFRCAPSVSACGCTTTARRLRLSMDRSLAPLFVAAV